MDNSQVTDRKHGLTLVQWGVLLVAFMVGVGSTFALREVLPPANAGVLQAVSKNSDTIR